MSINPWGSQDPAEVAKGGTGASSLTDHAILLGSGTSPVTVTSAPTNGQLLIGNSGSDPSLAVPTGDTNEIAIGTGAGSLSVGIADNCVLPGTSSYTWVSGTTAQEPAGSNGQVRYDTDTDKFRGYENGEWKDFITSSTGGAGMWTLISTTPVEGISSTIPISGYTIYCISWDNVTIPAHNPVYIFLPRITFYTGASTGTGHKFGLWTPGTTGTYTYAYTATSSSCTVGGTINGNLSISYTNASYGRCEINLNATSDSPAWYVDGWGHCAGFQSTPGSVAKQAWFGYLNTTGAVDGFVFTGSASSPITFDVHLWGMNI